MAVFWSLEVRIAVFAIAVAIAFLPRPALAHLLDGNRGPVDAFNYDEETAAHLNEDCAMAFECMPNDVKGVFFYGCHYDAHSAECQCSEGELSKCDVSASSLGSKEAARLSGRSAGLFTIAAPVKSAFGAFSDLPFAAKAALAVVAAVALLILLSRMRDNAQNNLRKAKSLHERASAMHEKGNEDEAKALFEKASHYRERSQEMSRNELV